MLTNHPLELKNNNQVLSEIPVSPVNGSRYRVLSLVFMLAALCITVSSCNLFSSSEHIDAFGYELEIGGEVIAIYDAGAGSFVIPGGTGFYYDGKLAISSKVLNEEGYTDIITIHFWDKDKNRQDIPKYEDDGGDGEWLLGWNDQIGRQLNLQNGLIMEKVANETWKFRFYTEQRGITSPQSAGEVVFEIWHIDHSDFTAGALELYVLTEYQE